MASSATAGWLTKQGKGFKTWRRRWFIMGTDAITYQESDSARKVKGTISLSQITQLLDGAECGKVSWPITDLNRCWGIQTQDRVFLVFADSVEDVMRWKLSLAKIILSSQTISDDVKVKTVSMVRVLAGKGKFFQEKISQSHIIDLLSFYSLAGRLDLREMCIATLDAIAPGEAHVLPPIKSLVEVEGEEAPTPAPATPPTAAAALAPAPAPAAGGKSETIVPAIGHGRTEEDKPLSADTDALQLIEDSWSVIEKQLVERAKPIREEHRKHWRTVRIFVSSTFADMFSEREILVRQVFPKLRAWCDPRRIEIIECDLRWGVPKESTSEVVFRTCLGEIDRSKEENGNVFFINLLGDRYGWVPTAEQVPPSVASEYDWVPDVSITHMEILHGAYRDQNPNAAFFVRDPSFLESLPAEFLPQFVDSQPLHKNALVALKSKLRERFPASVYPYTCTIKEIDRSTGLAKVHLDNMELFAEHVFNFLTQAIEKQYPLSDEEETPRERLAAAHERVIDKATRHIFGREKELAQVLEWCSTPGIRKPMFIVDENGQGKSTFMALCAKKARERGHRVFFHCANADYHSSTLYTLMERLVLEFSTEKPPEGFDMRVMSNLQEHIRKLVLAWPPAPNGLPTLVFVDAVEAFNSRWVFVSDIIQGLITFNTDNVKFIYSCDQGNVSQYLDQQFEERYKDDMVAVAQQKAEAEGLPAPARDEVPIPEEPENTRGLDTLERDSREEFVRGILASYNKRLDAQQMEDLLNNSGSISPLWLAIACEELRVYGVFETVSKRIKEFAPEVVDLLRQVLRRIEQEDDSGGLLHKAICMLAMTECIPEKEMLDVLGTESVDDNGNKVWTPIPMSVWAATYGRIKPLLGPSTSFLTLRNSATRNMIMQNFVANPHSDSEVREVFGQYSRTLANYFRPTPAHEKDPLDISRRTSIYVEQLLLLDDKKELVAATQQFFWRFATFQLRRSVTLAVRCKNPITRTAAMPVMHEKVCMGCYGRVNNMGQMVRNTCAVCKNRVWSAPQQPPPPTFTPSGGESLAFSCRQHNPALYNVIKGEVLHQKCFVCSFILQPGRGFPLLVCPSCTVMNVTSCCRTCD